MLLYEYPPKCDKLTEQLVEFNASNERKKIRRNALKNVLLALVIFVISFFIENAVVRIFVVLLSLLSLGSAYVIYLSSDQLNDKRSKTKIYDDRIEHSQTGVFLNRITEFVVPFDDVESSAQNIMGDMVFRLKNGHNVSVKVVSKGKERGGKIKDNCVTLLFANTKPKLFLIDNLHERINYPKKNYLPLEDDDEDDWN